MKIIEIKKEKYDIVKSKRIIDNAFANIKDREITVIIEQGKMKKEDIIKIEKGYKLIKFNMILPFSMVGFIANISRVLANEKIPIFVMSSYSTDYILVKEKYLKKAVGKLKILGFVKK